MKRNGLITAIGITGELQNDGTYNSHASVSFASEDGNGSGVDKTFYSINGSEWIEYQNPVEFLKNGTYVIAFKSVDRFGNKR